jgi:hypothetical protein
MNTGIQDMFNPGWKLTRLIQVRSTEALLDRPTIA